MAERILIITPVRTPPVNAGNRARIAALVAHIEAIGFAVDMLYTGQDGGDAEPMRAEYGDRLFVHPHEEQWSKQRLIGVRLPLPDRWRAPFVARGWTYWKVDAWYDDRLSAAVERLCRERTYRGVIAEYVFVSKALEAVPSNCLKILDTHDVYSHRQQMLARAGIVPDWFFTIPSEEVRGLERADRVVAIQAAEAESFRRLLQDSRPVHTVGHLLPPHPGPRRCEESDRSRVVFVGSDNLLNADALGWFCRTVWPMVLDSLPGAEFHVYGKTRIDPDVHRNVFSHGEITSISRVYETAGAVINPIRAGSGLKIKSLEALAHGAALISTGAGGEGLPGGDEPGWVRAESASEFADAVIAVLRDSSYRKKIQERALQTARDYYRCQVDALAKLLA